MVERLLVIRTSLFIPIVEFWLRRTSVKVCNASLNQLADWMPPYRRKVNSIKQAERIATLITYANRRFSIYPADCLTKSLVLSYSLQRLGHNAELCLGARRFTGQFEAHAWIEVDGNPVGEELSVNTIYTRFERENIGPKGEFH